MESADNGAPAASLPPSSQDKHGSNSPSLQLSPKNNDHQSPSQIDPALLTQLPPTAGTQSSMPLESQCSQLLLATQPNYNDSMLQTQLSRYNDHHGMDEEEDAAERQSSQHLLLTTQPTHENKTEYYGGIDDLSVKGDPSQPNTQEYTSELEHLSMTQQQQSLLLTQQLQQQHQCRDNNLASSKEYEKSPKQSHEDENDDAAMSSPEQPMNEQVDFSYNTQQNNDEHVEIDDESDNDDSDNDDMERLVEQQNLAVSLSMEVIEECEESQRCSRDNNEAYSSSVSCCNVKHGGTDCDEQDKPYKPPAAGFGFTNVGSGKSIAVDEAELAKADKLLADDAQQKTSNDYDKQDQPYKPPGTGFGFMNVGSGKSIAVGEEEMAKADKLLAENTQQKSSNGSDFDEQDEPYKPPPAVGLGFTNVGSGRSIAVDEAELDKADKLLADDTQQKTSNDYDKQDEPYNPLAAGFGFTNVGSGKSIAVNEAEMVKADKLLADDTQQKTSSDYDKQDEPYNPLATGFGFTNVGSGRSITVDENELDKADKLLADDTQQKTSNDYDKQDEPYNPLAAGFGFTNVGSGKSIAVNEAEMVKADKLLADDTQQKTSSDYDKQDEPYNPLAAGFGFTNVGSGRSIAVDEEELAKANKLLADNTQQKTSNDSDYDEEDEPYKSPPAGFGFTNVGSGKSITVDEEELAKANKLLADDAHQKSSNDYDKQDEPYNPLAAGFGFTNVGSGKSIAVNEAEMVKADKLLADDTQQKTSSDYDKQDEPYNPLAAGFGFTNVGSGRSIAVDEEELAKANKLLADNTQQKTSNDSDYDEEDEPYKSPPAGFGFTNVGSGKSITVDEEELAKANKLLADDAHQKSSNDHDNQDKPYTPPAAGFGFTNVGSGRSIAVDEEEMAKADKLLAENTQQKTSSDYDEQDEPYNPPPASFGFTNVGSGRSIAVDEEEMAKADKLLADDTQQKTSSDYDKQDEPYNPLATGFGFTNVGSGRSITVDENELVKVNKLLADDAQQKTSNDHDEEDEPYNPPATGFGFTNVGSGKSVAVDEAELAKADKMLAEDDNNTSSCTTTAAPAVVASKMTPKYQRSQQANPTTVTNPYVRKRSIDQISNACAGNSNAASAVSRANLTAPTPSRRLVFNPYAKTGQSTTKAVVRNPYAKIPSATAAAAPINPSFAMPPSKPSQFSSTVPSNPIAQTVTNASSAVPPTGENQFGFKGISFSLPIAERLPSRNVSYTPAEILTVGELHQYLYGANATNDFKHLQSVRITGTLLSVAVSSSDEKDGSNGNLYSSGTFLLIGDPLETNRLQTKPLPPKLQTASSQGNANSVIPRTVTKSRPMSILRNKHTPSVRTTQATLASTADGKPIATPVVTKQNNQAANITIKKKPALRGGLLNNSKPKKFVYAGNKNRSSLGGGLHRKFVTPKRASTLAVPNTTGRVTSSVIRNRPLSMGSGRKNVKIETVIQCHPAPLVPVWIGSSLDDDGLDGSVVNDLVMVMGEIVVEHCSGCRQQSENGSFTVNEQSTSIEGNEDDGQNVEENNLSANEGEKLQPTVIKNVIDAALSIAATVSNNAESTCQSTKKKQKPFCSQCVCFLSARIVKNANGTDMNLQKESLRVRREYFIQRKKQMECLMQGMVTNPAIYSFGCGPFANDRTVIDSN